MINIPVDERNVTDEQVFAAINLDFSGMESVKQAVESGDMARAKIELVNYMHNRKNVKFLFDYRGIPLKKIYPNESPYSYQSSLGLTGDLRDICLYTANKMMQNIYVMPGGNRGEIDLGANLENMIHFNFLTDQGKRHRTYLDMFVRGQFFESMAVLYHENGDKAVLDKFSQILKKFFETYPLQIKNTSPDASRFQLDEDRDVMSVGWLIISFISLFYTELPYAINAELAFEIIKRIWFLGIQFRRFDKDTYRPYNHHMWERGLVPFILGTLLPEIPDFVDMKSHGAEVVRCHIMEDFNDRGGYNEHSIAYWSGAAVGEMIYRGIYIARLNNETLLDTKTKERIDKTLSVLAAISTPDGRYFSIGDNGGPLINPILDLGIKMTENKYCKELLDFRTEKSDKVTMPLDYCDDVVGFTSARTGFDKLATQLQMSTKVNCGYTGHNHMDMLSLMYIVRGKRFFDEPYSGHLYHNIRMNSKQRGFMYNMTSHNTVLAYGKPIMPDEMYANKWGVFRPDSPVSEFHTDDNGMYMSAYHYGYTFCSHIRNIAFSRNGNLIVKDRIQRGNRLESSHIQRWHLMPEVTYKKIDNNTLLLENNGIKLLCLWQGAEKIDIYKNTDMLCPELYPSKNSLGYVLDIYFHAQKDMQEENITVSLDALFLDVTGKELPDIQVLEIKLKSMSENLLSKDTLEELLKM